MKKFDTSLEAKQLKLFLTLIETRSLTKTAELFGVGQSAVSHTLNRLREELRDPLFVRSGRGIEPTPYSRSIVSQVEEVMRLMEGLAVSSEFDLKTAEGEFVIAANEYQRDIFLPQLFEKIYIHAPHLRLRIVSIPFDTLSLARNPSIDLMITPLPPEKNEVYSVPLSEDCQAIFFDPECRDAPVTEADFLSASYVVPSVIYDEAVGCIYRQISPVKGRDIVPKVVVNTFAGVASFLRGSDMLAPLPRKLPYMAGFASCNTEGTYNPINMYLCWHQRNHHSPLHQWFVREIQRLARQLDGCRDG